MGDPPPSVCPRYLLTSFMLQNGPSLPPLFLRSCPACQCRLVDLSVLLGTCTQLYLGTERGVRWAVPNSPCPNVRSSAKMFIMGSLSSPCCYFLPVTAKCHPCELSIVLKSWGTQYQQVSVSVSVVSIVVVSIIMVSNCPSLFLSCHLTLLLSGSCS